MNRRKEAAFLADCLAHMPKQPKEVQAIVNTVIAGLNRMANGGEWTKEDFRAYKVASLAADGKEDWVTSDATYAATWAVAWATSWWPEWLSKMPDAEGEAAKRAALVHPDPDAERARQAKVREEMGL